MSRIINAAACKAYALEKGKTLREWKPERVSAEFLEQLDLKVKRIIEERIMSHPSKGKTLNW